MLLGAGCSSSGNISLQQACSDLVQITRRNQAVCVGISPEPDESALIARGIEACVRVSGASGSQVDASYLEQCAMTANSGCRSYRCAPFPSGTRQVGDPCLTGQQCASLFCSGLRVKGPDGTFLNAIQCGTCAGRLAEGASCDAATDACEDGFSCFGGACRRQGRPGGACVVSYDCAFPWICKSTGVCDSLTANGAPCSSDEECGTSVACDPVTKRCTPVTFGQPGDACDAHVHHCETGRCDMTTGRCSTILTDGAACDPADPSVDCDHDAYCFRGTCQIPDPNTCR